MRWATFTCFICVVWLAALPTYAYPPLFDAQPSTCQGPPYPTQSPLKVGVHKDSANGLESLAELTVNLNQVIPETMPLRMTSYSRVSDYFAVESFFDVYFEGQASEFPVESFFDVFVEMSSSLTSGQGALSSTTTIDSVSDNSFAITHKAQVCQDNFLILNLGAELAQGLRLRDVRIDAGESTDSFFDVFVEIDLPGLFAPDFNEPIVQVRLTGTFEPLTVASFIVPQDGRSLESGDIFAEVREPIDANSVYVVCGFETEDDAYDMQTDLSPSGLRTERIKRLTSAQADGRCTARAIYNDQGRIIEVEQQGKEADEPNDLFTFEYDDKGRLVEASFMKGGPLGAIMGGMSAGDYCDDCPRGLRKRPGRTRYSDFGDPNNDIEIRSSYDTDQRLASITYELNRHDHKGAFNFAYDSNDRLIMISCARDTDQDGSWDAEIVSMSLMGDSQGRLTRIYDSVSDSNILTWDRTVVNVDQSQHSMTIKSVFGDPNETAFASTLTAGAVGNGWVNAGDYTAGVPIGGGSVAIEDWNWGMDGPMPAMLVSADVEWNPLDGSRGDRQIGNRVILPVLSPDGKLAATLDADQFKICSYQDKKPDVTRKKGLAIGANGTDRNEVHFYDVTDDGSIAAMLTMDEHGHAIVSIGGNDAEKSTFNFFECWPSALRGPFFEAWPVGSDKEDKEKSTFNFFECWPSAMRRKSSAPVSGRSVMRDQWNYTNNPNRFSFFEAWPRAWGPQPYMPIYSETRDGTRYIAGAVTPGGAYSFFQYGRDGELEAIVRMNSVDPLECTEDIPGDLNGDCMLNFRDVGIMTDRWLECNLKHTVLCR